MRVSKKLLLGCVVAAAALLLAACAPQTASGGGGGEGAEGEGPAEVTVGVITSDTGPLAGYGKQYLDASTASRSRWSRSRSLRRDPCWCVATRRSPAAKRDWV